LSENGANGAPRSTGSRKLTATMIAMVLITVGYGATLWLTQLSKIDPSQFAANYLTFVGAISGSLALFVTGNAAVHIKGKDGVK
jgi:hypothetical protein